MHALAHPPELVYGLWWRSETLAIPLFACNQQVFAFGIFPACSRNKYLKLSMWLCVVQMLIICLHLMRMHPTLWDSRCVRDIRSRSPVDQLTRVLWWLCGRETAERHGYRYAWGTMYLTTHTQDSTSARRTFSIVGSFTAEPSSILQFSSTTYLCISCVSTVTCMDFLSVHSAFISFSVLWLSYRTFMILNFSIIF